MNKNGFTLIELIATIAIMLLITIIAVPSTVSLLNRSKEKSYELQVKEFETAAESLVIDNKSHWNIKTIETSNPRCILLEDLAVNNYIKEVPDNPLTDKKFEGYVEIKNTNNKITYEYKDDNNCITDKFITMLTPSYDPGVDQEIDLSPDSTTTNNVYSSTEDTSGANAPDLLNNELIPVVYDYNNEQWIKADTSKRWYNYSERMWANAIMVKEYGGKSRSEYMNAPAGTVINDNDILNMWVWVPRYSYSIQKLKVLKKEKEIIMSAPNGAYINGIIKLDFKTKSSGKIGFRIETYNSKFSATLVDNVSETTTSLSFTLENGTTTSEIIGTHYIDYTMNIEANKEYTLSLGSYTYNANSYINVDNFYVGTELEGDITINNQSTTSKWEYTVLDDEYVYIGDETYGKGSSDINNPGEIDIKFISSDIKENGVGYYYDNNIDNNYSLETTYYTHPAFTFGNKELDGIWVGKFLPSENYEIRMNARNIIDVDKYSFADKSIFGINNSSADIHMMKNIEWGAVAYLSQSKYGKYGDVRYPDKNIFKTPIIVWYQPGNYTSSIKKYVIPGCSTGGINATEFPECPYKYNSIYYGEGASTSGNVYGIYDMGYNQKVAGGYYGVYTETDNYFDKYVIYNTNNQNGYQNDIGYLKNNTYNYWYKGDATVETKKWYGGTYNVVNDDGMQYYHRDNLFSYSVGIASGTSHIVLSP